MKLVWPALGDPWLEGKGKLVPHVMMLHHTAAGLVVEYHWITAGERQIASELLRGNPVRHPHKAAFIGAARHNQRSRTEAAARSDRPKAYRYKPLEPEAAVIELRSVHRQLRQLIGESPSDTV